ncbi:Holliday junction branch migration protein RuvA [Rubrivirga sp. S365]|uniref:Holliday junction branch migration complex subunit RuvA n=1 Tax=Rubrivirga litoralis TaxID=3075598 RepID=A0ABU3BQG2_9BACT|nr:MULTISPECIES: Holliday junction branch migration protein RuvA [unclassified Rubrivirga]MDT0631534.1 Holliday junction branch migration protein RuvA [Rubrivirga sp. F394]MDT7855483.1 Holliday junction branch migration protein RuvA [Rubrivirga sp. S365]
MYAYVSGTLAEKRPTEAVIDAGGIGYRLLIPASSFDKLPAVGKPAKLLTTFVVREDAQTLYGFATDGERTAFETLTAVSGVGPKLALAALSAMSPAELQSTVVSGDVAMLTRVPGVGKRKAEKLIVELKDKFADLDGLEPAGALGSGDSAATQARADARAGLEALGLGRAEAERRLRKVLRANPESPSAEDLIRLALRES